MIDQKPEYLLGRTIFSISKHRWKVGPWNLYLLNPFQTQFCDSLGRATLASRPQILLHEFRDPNTHPISYHSGLSERFTQFLQCFSLPVSLWMVKKNVHSGPLASFQKNTPALLLTLQTPGNQIPPRRPHQTLPPWWLSAETQRMERQSSKSLDRSHFEFFPNFFHTYEFREFTRPHLQKYGYKKLTVSTKKV